MNERSQSVADSFADHVRAFHRVLPIEEQRLLERVFALATIAASDGQDTHGHAIGDSPQLRADKNDIAIESLLGPRSVGTKGFSWGESQMGAMA